MKKKIFTLLACSALLFMATNSFADPTVNTDGNAGDALEITAGNVEGVGTLIFNPSPQVWMAMESSRVSFAVSAVHAQALGTPEGKMYGMASDSTSIFWIDAEGSDVLTEPDTSDSTFFTDWNRQK